jgi:Phytanoyl-CoA dioxygenase (PhyH)
MVVSDTMRTSINSSESNDDDDQVRNYDRKNEPSSSGDDDDDDDDASDRINIMDGLSVEALAALLEFQLGGSTNNNNDDDNDNDTKFDKDTLCATYRPEDASRIAETLRRLHDRDQPHPPTVVHNDNDVDDSTVTASEMTIIPMSETTVPSYITDPDDRIRHLVKTLETDGVIRLNHVLSPDACQECAHYINQTLQEQDSTSNNAKDVSDSNAHDPVLFGNVFARDHRYDMYLHPHREKMISNILSILLHPKNSLLGQLFQMQLQQQLQDDEFLRTSELMDAEFHELSSLISDPGSMAQPLHPDSPYYPLHAPLWTVFVALQDITPCMGGTVVIPKTHTEEFHQQLSSSGSSHHNIKSLLLQSKKYQYCRADLNTGDCIVMDSRTFHYGGANQISSNARRTLLYFTIRNPYHQSRGYPDCNSIYPDLDGTLKLSKFFTT